MLEAVTVRESLDMVQQRKLAFDPDLPDVDAATTARIEDVYRTVIVGTDVPLDELSDTMEQVKTSMADAMRATLIRTGSLEELLLTVLLNTATIYVDSFLAGVIWQQRKQAAESVSLRADGPRDDR